MSKQQEGIQIDVIGATGVGKTVVGSIISDALTGKGFTNVTMNNQQGQPTHPLDVTNVLELVQVTRPEIFTTPIAITETTLNIINVEDGAGNLIGLAQVIDPGDDPEVMADLEDDAPEE